MGTTPKILLELKEKVMEGVKSTRQGPAYQALSASFPLVEIRSKDHHKNALKVIEHIIDYLSSQPSEEIAADLESYLTVLSWLVEKFEKDQFPIKRSSSRDMLAYLMETHGLKQTDLKDELGGQSVVSDILNGQRELNKRQIQALSERFQVSTDLFFD